MGSFIKHNTSTYQTCTNHIEHIESITPTDCLLKPNESVIRSVENTISVKSKPCLPKPMRSINAISKPCLFNQTENVDSTTLIKHKSLPKPRLPIPIKIIKSVEIVPNKSVQCADELNTYNTITPTNSSENRIDYITRYATDLLIKHGLLGWKFKINDRLLTTAGLCRYKTKFIEISLKHLQHSTIKELELTVLHELAHALAGGRAHHNDKWKSINLELGGDGKRCHKLEFAKIDYKYIIYCPNKCWEAGRHVVKKACWETRICNKCGGKIRVKSL